eukprot:scaffold38301_cov191-Amphora_coffeaeformis.AAC.2
MAKPQEGKVSLCNCCCLPLLLLLAIPFATMAGSSTNDLTEHFTLSGLLTLKRMASCADRKKYPSDVCEQRLTIPASEPDK